MDIYVGPTYIAHFKYSSIMNITFVTMMYGVGLPLLFPIACLSFFVTYCVERYQVAYTYQLPPAMDDTST